jgi:hypothetical protein
MSQNGPYSGPPWSHGGSDEPYTEPADPWGDQGAAAHEPAWSGHAQVPQQPPSFGSQPATGPSWSQPPPPKRNTPIIALVVTLGLLICIGLGATAWLLKERSDKKTPAAASSSAAANPGPAPQGSADARFNVKVGQCVVNQGTDEEPTMEIVPCSSGTFEVLKRVEGKTTGEKDAETKCAKVSGYTKWYYYDSPLDDFDFVLCLKEH